MKKSMWGQFWSAHQRFFKYLCIASKVRRVVQLAREEVQNGKVGLYLNTRRISRSLYICWWSFQCARVVLFELAGCSNFDVTGFPDLFLTPKLCIWLKSNDQQFPLQCVVIGLQSTGEARTLEALEEGGGELNDFVSTAKYGLHGIISHGLIRIMSQYVTLMKCVCCRGVLQSLIEKHFPAPDRQKLYSLLGIDLSAKKPPPPSDTAAQAEQKGKKRKGDQVFGASAEGS